MREKAEGYLDFFDFELTENGMHVRLVAEAPSELSDLAAAVCGPDGESLLLCVYEALNCIADADVPTSCEFDEKICPVDIFHKVLAEMQRISMQKQ